MAGVTSRQRRADPAEHAFLAAYDPRDFPPVGVTVDIAILTVRQGQLSVLLIRRGGHPYQGQWALPGGFVEADEDLDAAATRELTEETGLGAGAHLEQLRCYGRPGRDPRLRVFSVAYLALIADPAEVVAGTDAAEARFWPIEDLRPGGGTTLAFDHDQILADAVERARAKLEYTTLATWLLDEPFTIAELRRIYETVWGVELHPANFRRKVLATSGFVTPTGKQAPTGRGWAELYRRGDSAQPRPGRLHPALLRPAPARPVGEP
jgi:8-oxo-dGTP diphosphatase